MDLKTFFEKNNKVALAFSGGTDSSYLLYEGLRYGIDIRPYYIKSLFQPQFELDDANKLAHELGMELTVVELDVLSSEDIVRNPSNRCYYCKYILFNKLIERAQKDGYFLIIDGTNASDNFNDRPGMLALKELEVRSPLRECGITKDMVRKLSKAAGLFTWNKPSYSCLATRVPHETKITKEDIVIVEKAENILFDMGFTDFRVRKIDSTAKIQIPLRQMNELIDKRSEIISQFKPYFTSIMLDLEAR